MAFSGKLVQSGQSSVPLLVERFIDYTDSELAGAALRVWRCLQLPDCGGSVVLSY